VVPNSTTHEWLHLNMMVVAQNNELELQRFFEHCPFLRKDQYVDHFSIKHF
jgi:hypothetical protein